MCISKKATKVIGIVLVSYATFILFVFVMFHAIRDNPVDKAAMTYLWNTEAVTEQTGEIRHIGRHYGVKVIKTDGQREVPYSIETDTEKFHVYVTLVKENGKWKALGWRFVPKDW